MNWSEFRNGKLYDLLMAVPLILWFGNEHRPGKVDFHFSVRPCDQKKAVA